MIVSPSLIAALAVLAALAVGGMAIHHRGYRAGQAEREAHYAPLLRAQAAAQLAADRRAEQLAAAADAATKELESHYEVQDRALADRAVAAESHLADLLRHPPASCGGGEQVPTAPGPAPGTDDPSSSDDRAGRLAADLAGVGQRCEADAARVQRWQEWYRTQQELAKQHEAK
jgi:hypothetical protein